MFRRWLGFAGFGQVLEYSPAIRVSFILSYTVGVFFDASVVVKREYRFLGK